MSFSGKLAYGMAQGVHLPHALGLNTIIFKHVYVADLKLAFTGSLVLWFFCLLSETKIVGNR